MIETQRSHRENTTKPIVDVSVKKYELKKTSLCVDPIKDERSDLDLIVSRSHTTIIFRVLILGNF